jgi:electron transfer flavoprotein beta subunit
MVVSPPIVGVALKWAPTRLVVDPLTGIPADDEVERGLSDADRAALEIALLLAERFGGEVRAATVGAAASVGAVREALAAGAASAVHVVTEEALHPGSPSSCARTVHGLAVAFRGCAFVICGDYSPDGGSGSVPGLLAATVGAAQALGLVRVSTDGVGSSIECERRLDRGVREILRVEAPAVMSVEPAAARPRRASLTTVLESTTWPIEVVELPAVPGGARSDGGTYGPFRPRTRVAPAPPKSLPPDARVRAILGIGEEREPPRVVRAVPAEAAREIASQLRKWGYA